MKSSLVSSDKAPTSYGTYAPIPDSDSTFSKIMGSKNSENEVEYTDRWQWVFGVTRTVIAFKHQVKGRCQLYDDDISKMTNSRLFARFLSRFRLYNPNGDYHIDGGDYTQTGKSLPSLDAAWAYWEHVTMARHYTDEYGTQSQTFVRAPVGERKRPTELFPIWDTPVKDLMAFGVSVRMYFSTLLALATFLSIAGILNLPLVWYFWNYAKGDHKDGIFNTVKGSAICDETEWVECYDCNNGNASHFLDYRLDGEYVRVNTCDFDDWLVPGLLSYFASIILIITFGIAFFWLQRKAEVVFDEEIQTASDYSIKVTNPPRDAIDPEEWRHFFRPFANDDVALITIAFDNARLVKTLVNRRKVLKKLEHKLPPEVDMTDFASIRQAVAESTTQTSRQIPFMPTAERLFAKLKYYNEKIKELVQKNYGAVAVFVTFETERAQRTCLHALSTGKLNVWRNVVDTSRFDGKQLKCIEAAQSSSLDINDLTCALSSEATQEILVELSVSNDSSELREDTLRFRGRKVLAVKEANEPNDVRWEDLHVPGNIRTVQFFTTTLIMLVFLAWSGLFIGSLNHTHPSYTALYITVTNVLVPLICEMINNIESHATEASKNASLYIKVALFRWFNSGICLLIIMKFVETISVEDGHENDKPSLPNTVYSIIFAEMFTIPIIKVIDPMGNIQKHILAPRAANQEQMNSYFNGSKFDLAERYSDATKVVFVALFYSAILPESLFLGAVALIAHFWSGKFCLLRVWHATSDIGTHLSRLSRNYFFSTALCAHIIMGAYFWSGYPYDNVCKVDGEYQYCNQDMLRSAVFPPLPRFQPEGINWMGQSQALLTSLYGYTSLVMVLGIVYIGLKDFLIANIGIILYSQYEPDGEDQRIDLSRVKHQHGVHGYIPQVEVPGFPIPLLACDISGLDEDYIGWKDSFRGYEPHNLVNDVRQILGEDPSKPVFSIVKHWERNQQSEQHND